MDEPWDAVQRVPQLSHPRREFILRQWLRAVLRGINSLTLPSCPLSYSQEKKKKKVSGRGLQVWAVSRFLQVEVKAKGTWLGSERVCNNSLVKSLILLSGQSSLVHCPPWLLDVPSAGVLPGPLSPRPHVRWAVWTVPSCRDCSLLSPSASLGTEGLIQGLGNQGL